jgi:hypothetical protein
MGPPRIGGPFFSRGRDEPVSPIKSMSRRNRRAAPSFRRRFNDLEKEVE